MVNLINVMSPSLLQDMLDKGYVRKQNHPTEPLAILNYANKTMFDGEWNEVTRKTRGLIYNYDTGEVVSRPFEKFFNWSQIPADQQARLMNEPVDTYVKWDGSLGILYALHTGETAIATRGSFTSPQAQHATKVLRRRYPEFEPILGLTYLFEIVFPENRVVVDYKGWDDLVLLAVIDTATGRTVPSCVVGSADWPGPVNQAVGFKTLADVLAAPQEANQEGFVVHFPAHDLRVKIKFDEYTRLHKIMTNTSSIAVWEALSSGDGFAALVEAVPDEFYAWVHQQVHALETAYNATYASACDEYDWIMKRIRRPEEDSKKRRKEFALLACESDYQDILFGLYDGKDVTPRIWKRLRPEHVKPFSTISEDVA